jgi:hypothetical protein
MDHQEEEQPHVQQSFGAIYKQLCDSGTTLHGDNGTAEAIGGEGGGEEMCA